MTNHDAARARAADTAWPDYGDADLYDQRFHSLRWGHHDAIAAVLAHEDVTTNARAQEYGRQSRRAA